MGDDDPIARLRAQMDQARESVRELGGTLWAFHSSRRAEGFEPQEALALTITWLTEMVRLANGGSE